MRNPSSTPIRSVGIIRGKVRALSATVLKGARTIDAKGLVVAPGFVDLHWHGVDAADGGEVGELLHGARHDLDGPLAMTALHELVNFGSGPLSVLSQITILYWPRLARSRLYRSAPVPLSIVGPRVVLSLAAPVNRART